MQEIDLSKVVYPVSKCNMKIHIEGIYSFPQQWKTTDEANPNLFTYVVRTWKAQFTKGKIHPRQLTEKQQRQLEQSKKKGAKKQAKKQQNPQQQQRLRKQKQQQELQQKLKQQQWNKLTDQQKFYATCQNPFKSSQLKFQNNLVQLEVRDNVYVVIQQRITKDKGQWIYIYKIPTANEEQIAKIKKSKPKNLNLNDLNPILMRGWMDLSDLNSKQKNSVTLRCKLMQVDRTPQTPQPNLEKTYIKINLSLEKPFLRSNDGIEAKNFIKNPPKQIQIASSITCVQDLKGQLRLAMQSLAMEYAGIFWKQLNMYQQQKNSLIFTNTKKNQANKRKQQFLYDFNVSGKYKILKDRIKRSIVSICKNKYGDKIGHLSAFTGIHYDQKDQFYSQIYQFLVENYKETLAKLIWEKMEVLGATQVLAESTKKQKIKTYLDSYLKQELAQKIDRILNEYQNLYEYKYGQRIYRRYMEQHPKQTLIKYKYAVYCLKNNLASSSVVLPYIEEHLQFNKQSSDLNLLYLLVLISSQEENSIKKAWIILRQIISKDPNNIEYLMLGSFLLQNYLKYNQGGLKYQILAERNILRKQGKICQQKQHKDKPSSAEIPTINSLATYQLKVSPQLQDEMWVKVAKLFTQYNLIGIVSKIIDKIQNKENLSIKTMLIKVLISEGKFNESLKQSTTLYQNQSSQQVLQLIIKILFYLKNYHQLQKYLKISLKTSPASNRSLTLLRLALIYLQNHKYSNAKACLVKYIQKYPKNSGLSWKYLGYCLLKQGNYDEGIQCLRHANLLDPNNPSIWDHLALAFSLNGNFIMVNQALNQSQFLREIGDIRDEKITRQIRDRLKQIISQDYYKEEIRKRVIERVN